MQCVVKIDACIYVYVTKSHYNLLFVNAYWYSAVWNKYIDVYKNEYFQCSNALNALWTTIVSYLFLWNCTTRTVLGYAGWTNWGGFILTTLSFSLIEVKLETVIKRVTFDVHEWTVLYINPPRDDRDWRDTYHHHRGLGLFFCGRGEGQLQLLAWLILNNKKHLL